MVFGTPLQMNDGRAAVQIRGDEEGADIGEDGFLRRARNEQIESFHRPVLFQGKDNGAVVLAKRPSLRRFTF